MKFRIEYVVYVYIGVCASMIFFNCFLMLVWNVEDRMTDRKSKQMALILAKQTGRLKQMEPIDGMIQKKLEKSLRKSRKLLMFYFAVLERKKQEPELMEEYLQLCCPLFSSLVYYYQNKEFTYQAFFAFVVAECRFKASAGSHLEVLTDQMFRMVVSESAYCRENALKALYSFGNARYVYQALKLIDANEIFHHEKLITDGLLSFHGDREELAAVLWRQFNVFGPEIQISIAQFIRNISDRYAKPFLEALRNDDFKSREVKLTLLRYFTKYYYEPARFYLYDLLDSSEEWESVMIAANALRLYESPKTIEYLKRVLNHRNWYVRQNAAESLQILNVNFQTLASIYNGGDRYAREVLIFQSQQQDVRESARREEGEQSGVY